MDLRFSKLLLSLIVHLVYLQETICERSVEQRNSLLSARAIAQKVRVSAEQGSVTDINKPHHYANSSAVNPREARRIFPFNLLNKPKVSKLYLVNGTLCRFVGFAPVCTTLSTTPLLQVATSGARPASGGSGGAGGSSGGAARPASAGGGSSGGSGSSSGGGSGGGSSGGSRPSSGSGGSSGGGSSSGGSSGGGSRPTSGISSGGSSIQYVEPEFVSAAVMDEHSNDVRVEQGSNSSGEIVQIRKPLVMTRPLVGRPAARPLVMGLSRPLNLFPFKRTNYLYSGKATGRTGLLHLRKLDIMVEEVKKKRPFKTFTYRGVDLDQLVKVSQTELKRLFPARLRRKLNRGLKRKPQTLLRKLRRAKKEAGPMEKPAIIKTHLRNMVILPEMIGSIIGVYNGRVFNQVEIKAEMVGHYLGEFSITYKPVKHGRPGIGATHSSRFIPLK